MPPHFLLYVEGPRDRELLSIFAQRDSRALAKGVKDASVILGGRQPARAVRHLEESRLESPEVRGLCVLDRDDPSEVSPASTPELEFFTWSRRHIESYLLVPRALRKALAPREDPRRLDRILRDEVPDGSDEALSQELHAKRLLGAKGPFARALGRTPDLGRVARNLRLEELHPDVVELLGKLRRGLGINHVDVIHRRVAADLS
jgi:hypothetical protein